MDRGEGLGPIQACDEHRGGFDLLVVGRADFRRCLKGEYGLGGVCRPVNNNRSIIIGVCVSAFLLIGIVAAILVLFTAFVYCCYC